MKTIKVIMTIAAVLLISAPLQEAKAQSSAISSAISALTSQNGKSAGSALLSLYTQYKADKKIDLTNPANISNILTIANNIKGLAQASNTTNFLSGLISGSKNLVNNNNSSSVLSSLKSLSGLDLSSLAGAAAKSAATSAAKSAATSLLSKATGAASTASSTASAASDSMADKASSILTSLFKKF